MKITRFQKRCEQVAEKLGLEVIFFEDTNKPDQFEDDGTLHVQNGSLRACFDVSNGQALSGADQNSKTRLVMAELKLRITDRVLVGECNEEEAEAFWA